MKHELARLKFRDPLLIRPDHRWRLRLHDPVEQLRDLAIDLGNLSAIMILVKACGLHALLPQVVQHLCHHLHQFCRWRHLLEKLLECTLDL
ncbi:hypothetical protein CHU93_00915 [Sandarakinorhabdus cyanobacteriorum]|uniref:Uncharacterized protein n=1 Tax=Sandarakinorhabdus cyanobacteriorum TaxID=1981098 RepID=A0A255Z6S1_9SPHN|nr:hypothetical protein CHU93_00915 [Sandarakinorhabdus cyanobacteriorum]